jgi:type VI secretion system protein VasG
MLEISRVALFGKLNPLAYKAIESATVFCKMRGNPYVELAHWVHQILQLPDSDLHRIVRRFELNQAQLARDLTESLDRQPRGATSVSDFSSHVEEAIERGWVYGSLMFGEAQVRTGHIVVGILRTGGLRNSILGMSPQFGKVKIEVLCDTFSEITDGSPETGMPARDGFQAIADATGDGTIAPAAMQKQEALKRFSIDLTEKARKGEIDPVVGRDQEIRQIIDILMRRRQNNPILTGEAGVGKTALVEGFALRVARGEVPLPLKEVSVRALDIGLLQAGASMRGEFESRLRAVIDEVQASPKPIILFIDEAHTLIGAGGAAGTGDAANLLKPALARGFLRTIAATTWTEYKKYFEKDPALTRRFQVVQVGEPSETQAILMMRQMASPMEKHHRVQILDEALEAAVRLSHRYIPARQLPDKAVSLLDTAAARVGISLHAVPPEVEDSRHRIEALDTELEIIGRETAVGFDTAEREAAGLAERTTEAVRLTTLEERWQAEKALVDRLLGIRSKLRAGGRKLEQHGETAGATGNDPVATERAAEGMERVALLDELKELQNELATLQGDSPLILPTVDAQAVAAVVADWTGIPVGRMVRNEIETVLRLADTLNQRIIGQRHALDMIARRIQTSRARLDNPGKPIGVFMLCGPSGVGKTETALTLAEALYGGENNVITINMSEFQEAHTVSTLKGAPPGYVGYGEGGILTEAVRRRPYSVVLLDEVEKAHPDVHEIFFQVFDKGQMEDGEGRLINFRNALILLTTNVGSELIMSLCRDPELMPEPEAIAKALREPLLKIFPAALLGRIVTIPYYPLSDEMIGNIIRLQLGRIQRRVDENHGLPFTYDEAVIKLIADRCTELESGGRMIDAILTNTVLPKISAELLTRMMEGRSVDRVHVSVHQGEFAYAFE